MSFSTHTEVKTHTSSKELNTPKTSGLKTWICQIILPSRLNIFLYIKAFGQCRSLSWGKQNKFLPWKGWNFTIQVIPLSTFCFMINCRVVGSATGGSRTWSGRAVSPQESLPAALSLSMVLEGSEPSPSEAASSVQTSHSNSYSIFNIWTLIRFNNVNTTQKPDSLNNGCLYWGGWRGKLEELLTFGVLFNFLVNIFKTWSFWKSLKLDVDCISLYLRWPSSASMDFVDTLWLNILDRI